MHNTSTLRSPKFIIWVVAAVIAVVVGMLFAISTYDWQGMVLVVAVIGLLAFILVPRLTRADDNKAFLKILVIALLLKLVFSMLRNWTGFYLYGGSVDASRYDLYGEAIANYIWNLDFASIAPYLKWGTSFMELFTGLIYSVIGPSLYGGYLVFACLAFLGSYYFYRAFRLTFPDGNTRLFTILIFFFPSLLFWPNGIGKDSIMFLFLGLFAYGGARLIKHQSQGLVPLAFGVLGTFCIRPHISAIVTAAFVLAFLFQGIGKKQAISIVIIRLVLAVALIWLVLPRVTSFIGLEELSPQSLLERFEKQQEFTSRGGSSFQVMDVNNPLTYPLVFFTLLFRPFPWEAHNLYALIQSMESILVMGIVIWRIKSLWRALLALKSNTYVWFLLFYTIAFTMTFSIIGNFGILARERCMLLPFFFMFIAYSPSGSHPQDKIPEIKTI
jgi:hypothetical protein